jgi:hypothetical protein
MKTRIFLLVVFALAGSYSYGQTKSKRTPLKMVHLELVGIDPWFIIVKDIQQVPTKDVDETESLNPIYIGCRPVDYSARIRPYYAETITALRSPRRDISVFVLNAGSVIESLTGEYSIRGSRNQPLTFLDGVKTRGNANLPAASISEVVVISGGLPANIGDTNSGVVLVSSLATARSAY